MIRNERFLNITLVVLSIIGLLWAFGPYVSGRDYGLSIMIVVITSVAIGGLMVYRSKLDE